MAMALVTMLMLHLMPLNLLTLIKTGGDNSDAFPLDPNETLDSDGDGLGDNQDALPFNAQRQSTLTLTA